ncbi:uncharacterized protein LOC135715287 [Ochlerotatus camptorhynchus]|uniref:uncharacterized protein LOC135715287 n=1 Tax=Ochlerotatus camptorhynchus TaxID=644619 RepID=UPI0031E351FB
MENKMDDMGRQQEKCLLLLAQANAKIDSLSSALEKKQTGEEPEKSLELTLTLNPVKSLEDLEASEELCKDDCYVEKVVRSMGQIHGTNRFKNDEMIDYFVDRRFFRHYSWTGISKTFDENQQLVRKIAFSKYDRYINLFYRVIRNANEDFTKNDCNKFLKQCLRNSKQRLDDTKMLRLPAARNRRKALPNHSEHKIEYLDEVIDQGQL